MLDEAFHVDGRQPPADMPVSSTSARRHGLWHGHLRLFGIGFLLLHLLHEAADQNSENGIPGRLRHVPERCTACGPENLGGILHFGQAASASKSTIPISSSESA